MASDRWLPPVAKYGESNEDFQKRYQESGWEPSDLVANLPGFKQAADALINVGTKVRDIGESDTAYDRRMRGPSYSQVMNQGPRAATSPMAPSAPPVVAAGTPFAGSSIAGIGTPTFRTRGSAAPAPTVGPLASQAPAASLPPSAPAPIVAPKQRAVSGRDVSAGRTTPYRQANGARLAGVNLGETDVAGMAGPASTQLQRDMAARGGVAGMVSQQAGPDGKVREVQYLRNAPVSLEEARARGLIYNPAAGQSDADLQTAQQMNVADWRRVLQGDADAAMQMTSPAALRLSQQMQEQRDYDRMFQQFGGRRLDPNSVEAQQQRAKWREASESAFLSGMSPALRAKYESDQRRRAVQEGAMFRESPAYITQKLQSDTEIGKAREAGLSREADRSVEREKIRSAAEIATLEANARSGDKSAQLQLDIQKDLRNEVQELDKLFLSYEQSGTPIPKHLIRRYNKISPFKYEPDAGEPTAPEKPTKTPTTVKQGAEQPSSTQYVDGKVYVFANGERKRYSAANRGFIPAQ